MKFELFSNIKLNKLIKIINFAERTNKFSSVKLQYLREDIFFQEHINFLISLKIMLVKKNIIILKINKNIKFQDLLIKKLKIERNYTFLIKEYLSNFEENEENELSFVPENLYNLKSSDLRNFLISLKIIKYTGKDYIIINKNFFSEFVKTKFSPQQLNLLLHKKALLGLEAEKLILKYEKDKLKKYNKKLTPKHIALEDVSAGYDILSYQKENNSFKKIYIEVKAVSSSDYRFFLSNLEFTTSLKYKSSYYIYLLPVDYSNVSNFDYEKIIMINDITKNVFNDMSKWSIQNDGYLISKK